MVNYIKTLSFSDRKYNFKIMVYKLRSQKLEKNKNPDSKLKVHIKPEKLDKNPIKNPEIGYKFQKKYQDEFETKIKLMEEIRKEKMENIEIRSIYLL